MGRAAPGLIGPNSQVSANIPDCLHLELPKEKQVIDGDDARPQLILGQTGLKTRRCLPWPPGLRKEPVAGRRGRVISTPRGKCGHHLPVKLYTEQVLVISFT